ncbi:MAG TPA: thermonuclease family protein [Candidatus Saccharimonadales bacterium]|nr:thermonuclease family protein [Candidatus Saccharimonadales bacterium]
MYKLHSRVRGWTAAILLLISLAIWAATQAGWMKPPGEVLEQNQPGLYSVKRFIDGDTIAVNMNGKIETIRFVGIDTPETHKPNTPVQCYGPAAAAFTKNLIGNKSVRLVSDSLSTNRDRYDRLLRYVYLPDGTLVNQKLVQNGYAFYYPYFPFTKSKLFEADQQAAMASHKGLWGNCSPTQTEKGGYISNPQG